MRYDEFIGQVQHRAQLADSGAAAHAIHATLETLGERLSGDEVRELAAQLPVEIGAFLQLSKAKASFGMDGFFDRVRDREGVNLKQAMHHARVVISVLVEAVSAGEIEDVRAQLPQDLKWILDTGDNILNGRDE
jgi:uncharacterized protein (DUF2267 family)